MTNERKCRVLRIAVRTYLVCQLLMLGWSTLHAQDAASILRHSASVYEQSQGIRANFTMQMRPEQGDRPAESFEGVIYMKGDKFKLQTPDMVTWYDGETQWTYMERTEEVNVTTPKGDELQFTNPAVLLHSYQEGFNASLKGSSTTRQGKSACDILLLPKKKNEILSVSLQIEKLSGFPASIDIEAKNHMHHLIVITEWNAGANLPDDFFVFNEDEYPDAEVVDLR